MEKEIIIGEIKAEIEELKRKITELEMKLLRLEEQMVVQEETTAKKQAAFDPVSYIAELSTALLPKIREYIPQATEKTKNNR